MSQAEMTLPTKQGGRQLRLDWIAGVLVSPARQLREILAESQANWLTPLVVLSIFAVVEILVLGSLPGVEGLADPSMGGQNTPYQYYTPEQQAQLDQAMTAMDTPFFKFYLPAGLALAGVWFKWILLGAVLHLALTLIGGRGGMTSVLNLLAWASIPLLVRSAVHIAFILSTDRALQAPGLSGLLPAGESGVLPYLAIAARSFDIYFLWQLALVATGASMLTETRRARSWFTVALVQVGFLLLMALPGYLVQQLSDLTIVRPFLF